MLRPGNVHSAEGWRSVLEPVVARYRERGLDLYFRGDAAFSNPEIYDLLEREGIGYAIRLLANRVLQERIAHLLTRPVGRPPSKPQVFFASFTYQARSWARPRRVVAKVEWTGDISRRRSHVRPSTTQAGGKSRRVRCHRTVIPLSPTERPTILWKRRPEERLASPSLSTRTCCVMPVASRSPTIDTIPAPSRNGFGCQPAHLGDIGS